MKNEAEKTTIQSFSSENTLLNMRVLNNFKELYFLELGQGLSSSEITSDQKFDI